MNIIEIALGNNFFTMDDITTDDSKAMIANIMKTISKERLMTPKTPFIFIILIGVQNV